MAEATARAAAAVSADAGAAFSRAIMTTDRFAKECALEVAACPKAWCAWAPAPRAPA